ncbi:hypothetical protein D3C79_715480 [compost metagenome]
MIITQLRRPVRQLPLALAGVHPGTLPDRIVGVLDRQCGQRHLTALAITLIQAHQLIDEQWHRPAIGDDMVQGEHQHVLILRQFQQFHPQQRPMDQVERLLNFQRNLRLQRLLVHSVQGLPGQPERLARVDDLHQLAIFLADGRAQGLMALNQRLETALQGSQVELPPEPERGRNVVGRAGRLQLPEEPLALLGIGQHRAFDLVPDHGNGQLRERDALGRQLVEKQLLLCLGQTNEAINQVCVSVVRVHLKPPRALP